MPDFYIEMNWQLDNPIIPFFSKLAPSDTFRIWKYGRSLRCDTTYVGFKKLKVIRSNLSLIFNCLNSHEFEQGLKTDSKDLVPSLVLINRDKKTFYFPLQHLDNEEKLHIIKDLIGDTENI